MSRAHLIVPISEITRVTQESVYGSEPEEHRRRNSIESEQVDWEVAVPAARFLLDETFASPAATDNPVLADMAQELAALLCAYDEIVDAVEHMRASLPAPPDYFQRAGKATGLGNTVGGVNERRLGSSNTETVNRVRGVPISV